MFVTGASDGMSLNIDKIQFKKRSMSKLSQDFYLIPISDPGAWLTAETNAWRQPTQAMGSIGITELQITDLYSTAKIL